MSMRLWTNDEDKLIRQLYPSMGLNLSQQLGRTEKALKDRASILKVKIIKKYKKYYCSACKKELKSFNKDRGCYYSYKTKTGLCIKCVAKQRYKRRLPFSHNKSKIWTDKDVSIQKEKFYDTCYKELKSILGRSLNSISHKACRLGLKRNPKFMEEGNLRGRAYFIKSNPMKNPEMKAKSILANHRGYFSRAKMTSIEKKVADFLDSINIQYDFNKLVRTSKTFRFPDLTIGKLIIECDGNYWHDSRKKEDYERQVELEQEGFKVLRFSSKDIINNFGRVKECILLELNQ